MTEPVPALDGVRGAAILLVLAHNLNPFEGGRLVDQGVSLAFNFGWVGVQLFFVLSGYLISGILLDSREAPGYYRAFFGRRVLRIFPLYYGMLLVCLVILPALGLAPAALLADRAHSVWLWTYLINWVEPFGVPVAAFPHFWSLAVEEQFYLVLAPLIVGGLTVLRGRRLPMMSALGAIAAASFVDGWLSSAHGIDRAYYGTDTRALEFLVGSLLAVALAGRRINRTPARVIGIVGPFALAAM
ncbi:MAG: acyltransferase family protein, partial [bacterium]